jgi:hypothetical protein
MKLAALPSLWIVAACGSSKPADTTTTTPSANQSSLSATTPTRASTPTTSTTTMRKDKLQYSCFSYVTGNSKSPRHACMRTDECAPYLEQAKTVGGIRELSACANVATVFCFHQVSNDEPDGLEVCQPTLDECKTARADVARAKMSVDSDCVQR